MTVSQSYAPLTFVGNGATTAFAVSWPFYSATLVVTLIVDATGVRTVKTISTHYTVSGGTDANGLPSTGTVTMLTAPASGETLEITRSSAITQGTTFSNNDAFPAKTVEGAYDKGLLLLQETRDLATRAVRLHPNDYNDGIDPVLPVLVADKYLKVNSDGDALEMGNGIDWLGAWVTSTAYLEGQAVSNGGSSWICILDHTSGASSEPGVGGSYTTYWDQLAAPGATGATGATGTAGSNGTDPGLRWTFDSSTAMADPGAGDIRLNNATLSAVTALAVSDNTAETGNPAVESFVLSWDDSTTTALRGTLLIKKASAPQNFAVYNITGASTDNAGWTQIAVTYVIASGSFTNADVLSVQFFRTGNAGAGAGDLLAANNLSDVASTTTARSNLGLGTANTPQFTGVEVGHATDTTLARVSAGDVSVEGNLLYRAGGTDVPIVDGGTGSSTAGGAATNLGLGTGDSPQFTAINLGHATDTTIARSAAGIITVEGTIVALAGKQTVWVPAPAMTGRTTNGAASGSLELTTNDVMLRTFDFDQTTEEGVGFWVPLPKSYNNSTVTFQPYWTGASGTGGVVWGLAAYSFSDDDALDTAVSGQQTSTDTFITANDCHVGPESAAITIGGTPATGDLQYFEVTREVANGSDTLTADAKLIGIKLFITTNAANDA